VNAITILVRNDYRDIVDLNECFISIQSAIPETLEDTEIVVFHESGFDSFKKEIVIPSGHFPKIIFLEISLSMPQGIKSKFGTRILDNYPHPTHGNGPLGFGHPGFTIGYRSMCRFFAAEIFSSEIVREKNYQYLMRLDTDSRFLKGNGTSLFSWAESNQILYSYIKSAVQWDNFKMIRFFKLTALRYFASLSVTDLLKALCVPRGKVYYTNFEICNVAYFSSKSWMEYFNEVDATGGFYLHRWGDHIFRYMGVNVLLKKRQRQPIPGGFIYQHGGVFRSEDRASIRPHWLSSSRV
jgi:hypothetical protein